jgi:hypothetical protein
LYCPQTRTQKSSYAYVPPICVCLLK